MSKDYKDYFDENGILREFPTVNKIREITSQSISNKVVRELIDLQEVIIEKAAAGEYIFTWYSDLQDETVKFLEALGYEVAIARDGMGNKYDISWEDESLSKPKEEKPEFADDEIGAIAQEYGYVLKHLRDCTIDEILNICQDPDLKCAECEFNSYSNEICPLRKLTESDLATLIRVNVPKINKEKTDE